jgi:uncharacterized circularly permuted ATP-grasp superfamily protein
MHGVLKRGAGTAHGMLIGPHATARQREEFERQIEANPRNYIAQTTLDFSLERFQ